MFSIRSCLVDFLFSVKYKKPRCTVCFFRLNSPNVQGILAPKTDNVHPIFRQFSDIRNGEQSQQPSVLRQLVSGGPQHCPKES